ncbi:MAG: hypothetical protein R3B70_30820 [Polyangiaceae bacterium]
MTPADVLLCAFFGLWLLASILGQLNTASEKRHRFRWVRRYDVLGLVPTWTFFAPRPSTADLHLLYRDKLATGQLTPWTEVVLVEARSPLHILWNPGKRQRKLLTDAMGMLSREVVHARKLRRGGGPSRPRAWQESIQSSLPYLIFLHHVSMLPRLPGATATQFALFQSSSIAAGDDDPKPMFGIGLMFHLANAALMGLNTFVWSFSATYPAILFCRGSLWQERLW